MSLPHTILVPTDFSEHAERALAYAVDLAALVDATVHLLHVVEVPALPVAEAGANYVTRWQDAAKRDGQAALDDRVARYRDRATFAPPRLEEGDARDQIERVAALIPADLIVMGTHGRRGVRRLLLGSVAEAVVRTAGCPVLTIR